MTTSTHTFTARSPEDLIAAVPCVLGFHPADSVVMLTFGSGPAFHARVDLPDRPDDVPLVVAPLVGAALQHEVESVVLMAWSEDAEVVGLVLGDLSAELEAAGVRVIEMVRVEDDRWFRIGRDDATSSSAGVPYDVSDHPFAAESVLAGRVTHGSREELAATLVGADPAEVEEVGAAALRAAGRLGERSGHAEALWVRATVRRCADERVAPSAEEAGRLLVDLTEIDLRDVAWSSMDRDCARDHTDFWRGLVRRTPVELLAAPATLLAFAAWLSGDGALAWCALDRAAVADPDYSMAGLVAECLERAVPPHTWQSVPDDLLPALRPDA